MKNLVICGSTGKQGGALCNIMMNSEIWKVTGFTRNLQQAAVRHLESSGVTMLQADLADAESLLKVFEGAEAVFGLTQPWNRAYTKVNTELELKQGKNIIDACKKNGVKHLVFSSALHGKEEKTGLPHVDVKIDIEEYTRNSGLNYTFLNPVQFMDNVGMRFLPVKKGKIRGFIDGDARVPYVAVSDIACLAQIALENGEDFYGREIPLVGDLVSGEELAETLSRLRNEPFKYRAVPRWLIKLISREFYKMRLAFEEAGRDDAALAEFKKNIGECRALHPGMLNMESFLKKNVCPFL